MTSRKLWGGRFQGEQNKAFERFSRSFDFDQILWKDDLAVLNAHVKTLIQAKALTKSTGQKIISALDKIKNDLGSGRLKLSSPLEDIHSFIEDELEKRIGKEASLIRLGRSRNDTVVTDLRHFLKNEIEEIISLHHDYLTALIKLAERVGTVVIPSFTHLRKAQPVLFPFYCLSHFAAGMREREALEFAKLWSDESALGAGAISGTSWSIDTKLTAKNLGFSKTFFNAMDATSNRDFLLAFHFAVSLILTHLSRLCEDFILWSSDGNGYLVLSDAYCTGSSLMPQKKNPDALELIRGKTGRVFGHLNALFMTLKGLPSGYNRDLQEDKEPIFDSVITLKDALHVMAGLLREVTINQEQLEKIWKDDFSLATDLADALVMEGFTFAEAHEMAGKTVRYALEKKKSLSELTEKEIVRIVPGMKSKLVASLSIEKSAMGRESQGGTGKNAVASALAFAKQWLRKNSVRGIHLQ